MALIPEDNYQMFFGTADDFVSEDSLARFISKVINEVIREFKIDIPTRNNRIGRPPYCAVRLLKLCIYAYMKGITSCRDISELTATNTEGAWLLNQKVPSPSTISNFRRTRKEFIREVFEKFAKLLIKKQIIDNLIWVIDGHKIKAYASRDMYSLKNLQKRLEKQEKMIIKRAASVKGIVRSSIEIEELLRKPKHQDRKLAKLVEKYKNYNNLIIALRTNSINYISATDTDALFVNTRRGKCAGFNAQFVVDSAHHFIVHVELADINNDVRSLYKVIMSSVEKTDCKPEIVVADRGYSNLQDIHKLVTLHNIAAFVNLQESTREKESLKFTYDEENNQVICPQGKVLHYKGKSNDKGTLNYIYRCNDCVDCPIKKTCTSSSQGRSYRVAENYEFSNGYRAFMREEESKDIAKMRKAIIEHVFGTISHMMNYNGFKMRGRENVQTELLLYSSAYNMIRLYNIR